MNIEELKANILKTINYGEDENNKFDKGKKYEAERILRLVNKLNIPDVVQRYRVEAIAINKKHLFNKEIDGLENASEVFQDLKIKYLDTYTSVKMTEL